MLKTSGAFDRSNGPVYFIASHPLQLKLASRVNSDLLMAANECYNAFGVQVLGELLDLRCRLFLDSGVYKLAADHAKATGLPIHKVFAMAPEDVGGFDKLWALYADLLSTFGDRIWGAVEIDLGDTAQKRRTRERIQAELDWVPIPVFHPMTDPPEYFDELMSGYDRVCVGGSTALKAKDRRHLFSKLADRARAYPDTWVHWLGVTPQALFLSSPPDSADSSTWTRNTRWTSGHRSSAMLCDFGTLPLEMGYVKGITSKASRDDTEAELDEPCYGRAHLIGASQAHFVGRTWAAWQAELAANDLRGEARG